MPRPNILLITTDQQRYDTLGCCRAPIGRTPHLDRLAARGMIFDRCYDQNPVCIPSRACLQTGRYTWQHGVRYMESEIDTTPGLPTWERTFFDRLHDAGYHTAAFGKIHMMPDDRGFDTRHTTGGKGQRWTQLTGQDIGPAPLGWDYGQWLNDRLPGGYELIYQTRQQPAYKAQRGSLAHPLPAALHVESWIGDHTVDFLNRPPDQPWFCWCGFTGPHGPLDVPPEYLFRYLPEDMPEPLRWDLDKSDRFPYRHTRPRSMDDRESHLARLFTAYYHALMDLIDDQVARLVSVFDEQGLWDNTLVMFTSDHGEMRGDFGLYGKGNFYDPVTHVPTFVIPPGGQVAAPRFDGLIEMFDLAPTALDYAGVAIPETMAAKSLRPELESGRGGRDAVFCDYVTNDRARRGTMCRGERYKLCLWHEDAVSGAELYDLVNDPFELQNRAADPAMAGVRAELLERLALRRLEAEAPVPPGEWV